ncbi:MAG: endonuclease V, partial [Billgrantia desiderata]
MTPLHEWTPTPEKAIALQRELAPRIEREDRLAPVRHIAGVDIGFEQNGEITRAAVVVLAWPGDPAVGFKIVEQVVHRE